MSTLVVSPSQAARWGIALALYPGDASLWTEIQRAPDDVGGAPIEGSAEIIGKVEPGHRSFVDEMAPTVAYFHYRGRHVGDGYADGNWTEWIRVRGKPMPAQLPLAPPGGGSASKPLMSIALRVIPSGADLGKVEVTVDGEPTVDSVKLALSTSAYPAGGTGTAYNTDANGNLVQLLTPALTAGQTGYVTATFYSGTGGTGTILGTLRQSIDYSSIFEGDDPAHPWAMGGSFLELPRVTWKIPTGHLGLAQLELRVGGTDWATATSVWEGLAEEYTGSIDDVGTDPGDYYQSRSLTFRLGAYYNNGTFAEVDSVVLTNDPPNANGSAITAEHRAGTVTVSFDDFAACKATRLRFHASIQTGFTPSDDTVVGTILYPAFWIRALAGLGFKVAGTFAVPGVDTITPFDPIVLDGSQTLYIKVEMWDELTEAFDDPRSISNQLALPLSAIPSSDTELPGDPGELASLGVKFLGSRIQVKALYNSWPPGGKLVLRRDPTDTSDASWNGLTQNQKISKWNGGTDIDKTSSGEWEGTAAHRTYSVMARSEAMDGTLDTVVLHGYVEDLAPTPNSLTITVRSAGREVSVEIPTAENGGASKFKLHASTTNGFTPSASTVVATTEGGGGFATILGRLQQLMAGKYVMKYLAADAIAMGTTIYFKLEAEDYLTAVLGESSVLSNQFSHVLTQIPGETVFSLEAGAPTNSPSATGLAVRTNGDGSVDWQLQFDYTQGAKKADVLLVYARQGSVSAPTDTNEAVAIQARTGTASYLYEIKGVDGNALWSFGVAAGRRTVNGIEKTSIVSPTSAPDWTGRSNGEGNYTQLIEGTDAQDIETGANSANQGLDTGGNLISDIVGSPNAGGLYVSLGGGLFVGSDGSPTARSKSVRYSHGQAVPADDTDGWVYLSGYVRPSTANNQTTFHLSVVLPPGVTITGLEIHGYRQTTSDTVLYTFYRVTSSGTSTSLASAFLTGTGWITTSPSLSEAVDSSRAYSFVITLTGVAAAADARFMYLKVNYTMPQYEFTL